MESADLNAKDLRADVSRRDVDAIHHSTLTPSSLHNTGRRKKFETCFRCGRRHNAKTCKFKDATCHGCGKQGILGPPVEHQALLLLTEAEKRTM